MSKVKRILRLVKKAILHPDKAIKKLKVLMREEQERRKVRTSKLKISIVMPTYNVEPEWLEKAVNSVRGQTYTNWELCIADDCSTDGRVQEYLNTLKDKRIKVKLLEHNVGISDATNEAAKLATGEYLLLMDNDDALMHTALYELATCIVHEAPDIVYSDQDIIDEQDTHQQPLFKPCWSPDLLRCQMYAGHLLAFRAELYWKVGGLRREFNGSQDYDLLLRMTEQTGRIAHIEKVLYSWRSLPTSTAVNPDSKPYAQTAGLHALQEHLDRVYGEGKAIAGETGHYYVYDVRYPLERQPKVSIIIPIRDHVKYLKKLIKSIDEKTSYGNYEIVIVNNGSEEESTYEYFAELKQRENVVIEDAFVEFNWSLLNNIGMRRASGEVFLFMNNDMEIITNDWMERLAENAIREDVGVVGPLLLYPDDTIQHAGVVIGLGGWADHVFKGMKPEHYGSPYVSPMVTRNVMAVTGACMAISKKTMKRIGAFSEKFMICGSDIELCIRAHQAGLHNIYTPFVRLYHYESKSRNSYIPEVDFKMSAQIYAPYLGRDPYYNGQLDYSKNKPAIDYGKNMVYAAAAGAEEEESVADLNSYRIPEIGEYTLRQTEYPRKRINLLVPSVNVEHVFGGISTALKFFERLCRESGYDSRIILTDAEPHSAEIEQYHENGYCYVSCEDESDEPMQLVAYANRFGKSIPVSQNDYFMMTGWWTAHCIQEAYMLQEQSGGLRPNKFIYFIQDYEPGFYPWSSQYLLASATYRCSYDQIAVFNTSLLQDYMHTLGYHFYREYCFEPVLNDRLKSYFEQIAEKQIKKKKQILLYGRPGTKRNAFELIVTALRKWVRMQTDVEEWEILSAGESFEPVLLGNDQVIRSVGKLSIEEYGKVLEESYAGISLMVSPHPSYPPLEMATFGVKVLTNTFANKRWDDFSENILPIEDVTAVGIAGQLKEVCDGYTETIYLKVPQNNYLGKNDVFEFAGEIKDQL